MLVQYRVTIVKPNKTAFPIRNLNCIASGAGDTASMTRVRFADMAGPRTAATIQISISAVEDRSVNALGPNIPHFVWAVRQESGIRNCA
jgi:hypothetical protein